MTQKVAINLSIENAQSGRRTYTCNLEIFHQREIFHSRKIFANYSENIVTPSG